MSLPAFVTLALLQLFAGLPAGSVVVVVGLPRYGKSVLLQQADVYGAFPRRVVFDPYATRDRREATLGRPISPWNGRLITLPQLRQRLELLDRNDVHLVVQPRSLKPDAAGAEFGKLAELLWHTGGVDLLCEEAGLYSRHAVDLTMQLASGGGHAGMRLFLISQSVSRLHVDVRRHMTHLVAFAQSAAIDAGEISRQCGKDFAAAVQAQQKGTPPLVWAQGQEVVS